MRLAHKILFGASDRFYWVVSVAVLALILVLMTQSVPMNQVHDSTGQQVVPATATAPVSYSADTNGSPALGAALGGALGAIARESNAE